MENNFRKLENFLKCHPNLHSSSSSKIEELRTATSNENQFQNIQDPLKQILYFLYLRLTPAKLFHRLILII